MTDPTRDDEALRLAIRAGCAAINGHEGIDTVCEYPSCDCSGIIATKAIIEAYVKALDAAGMKIVPKEITDA